MSEWIPCDKRLPEVGEYGRSDFVWAHARGGDMFKGEYNIGDEKWYDVCNDEWIVGVTHWQPLPSPPGTDAATGEEELLEALQEALPVLEYVVRNGWDEAPPWGWPHDENYALDVVRAALDNARALRGSDES